MLRKGARQVVRTKVVGDKLDERVFIGTLGIDCLEYSKKCIDSVRSNATAVKFVYMDNGSTEESVTAINLWRNINSDIAEFQVVLNGYNAGVGPGWNKLIAMALDWGATKIIICNNDIVFGPHTVDGMCKAFNRLSEEVPETVMVTAANKTKNPDQLDSIPQEWNYHEHPDFSCFMISPLTIERVGTLSEMFIPGYFEDNEYHHRILLMGYKAWGTDWAPYCHIASRTRYAHPELVPHEVFQQNRALFYRNKLVVAPDQEVQDERYQFWLEHHPDQPHPDWKDVLQFCVEKGKISRTLISNVGAAQHYPAP